MAGHNGREFTFDWDSTTIVGVRTRSLGINNELVDVTNDDDNGWQTLLAAPGKRSIEVSIAGIMSNEAVLASAMGSEGETLEATLPTSLTTSGTVSGLFVLSSFTLEGEHDGEYEFSSTFMSSGAITYTASS